MIGFLIWLGYLLFPGLAIGELFGIWNKDEPLILRISQMITLGFGVDVLAGFLHGVNYQTIEIILSLSAFSLIGSITSRWKLCFWVRPQFRTAKATILFFILLLGILLLYFATNPYFQDAYSSDFVMHTINIKTTVASVPSIGDLPQALLYWGVYYVIAPLSLLDDGQALFLGREAMGILVLLSFFLVYECAYRIHNDSKVAVIATGIYSLGAFVWFQQVFFVGLWPNFYGVLASLILISATVQFFKKKMRVASIVLLILALINAAFSHYTVVIIIPVLLTTAVLKLGRETRARAVAYIALVLSPILLSLFLVKDEISSLATLAFNASIGPPSPTWLSWFFLDPIARSHTAAPSGLPWFGIPVDSLSYMVAVISNDWAALAMLLLIIPYIYAIKRSKEKALMLILPLWFLIPIVFGGSSARFSLIALMPLGIMAAGGIIQMVPFQATKYKRVEISPSLKGYGMMLAVFWLLVMPVPGLSWGARVVSTDLAAPSVVSQDQAAIVQTFAWMAHQNQSCLAKLRLQVMSTNDIHSRSYDTFKPIWRQCRYISIADWRFTLSNLVSASATYDAATDKAQWGNPQQTTLYAISKGADMIIVTKYISQPNVPYQNITLFKSQNFSILIKAVDDRIAQLNSSVRFGTLNAFHFGQFDNGTFYQQVAIFFPPWTTYNNNTMTGNNVVYESQFVRIWCIDAACKDWPKVQA